MTEEAVVRRRFHTYSERHLKCHNLNHNVRYKIKSQKSAKSVTGVWERQSGQATDKLLCQRMHWMNDWDTILEQSSSSYNTSTAPPPVPPHHENLYTRLPIPQDMIWTVGTPYGLY